LFFFIKNDLPSSFPLPEPIHPFFSNPRQNRPGKPWGCGFIETDPWNMRKRIYPKQQRLKAVSVFY